MDAATVYEPTDPAVAAGFRASYELRIGEERFRVEIADGAMPEPCRTSTGGEGRLLKTA